MKTKEEYPLDIFKKHVLTIIHESDAVKRYQFKQTDTWNCGFNLTCADNLIVMNGDCYTLILEPGHGRCGLAFLRSSVKNVDYFLSKCPLRENLSEYKYEYALEDVKEYLEDYCDDEEKGAEVFEQFKDDLNSEDGKYGEFQYYKTCAGMEELDEPPCATRMTGTTKMQIAGLMSFVEAYSYNVIINPPPPDLPQWQVML